MKNILFFFTAVLLSTTILFGRDPAVFKTQRIPTQPEVLTYHSKSGQGEGLYQVCIMKRDTIIEVYINMISPGFTKTISGIMTLDMSPIQSTVRIIGNNQVMETKCFFDNDKLKIKTVMMPYNCVVTDTLNYSKLAVDFLQVPIFIRLLQLEKRTLNSFTSLSPRTH